MSAVLRPGRKSDLDALVAIEAAAFAGDRISRRSFRRFLGAPTASLIVAEEDGIVAGYALLLFRSGSRRARLYSLAVGPSRRGTGLGRLLLGAAETEAARRGARAVGLEVREDNRRAATLYERNGYVPAGIIPGYYADGMAALRYVKALAEGTGHR
ncbi:MAG: GNAT family N-acetyltransferase [Rhizobiales bacterium]|nr:GNAT family N-acetyltransferase [Hyphomicrobiales bacterium]